MTYLLQVFAGHSHSFNFFLKIKWKTTNILLFISKNSQYLQK